MSDPRALYHATIVKHDREPQHHGPLPAATNEATIDNPLCGDRVTMRLHIVDGKVLDAAFEGRGCALSRAAASIVATRAIGATPAQLRTLAAAVEALVSAPADAAIPPDLGDFEAFVGVRAFKSRRICACLATRAMAAALES
ncbi:SUF system NifU family Fe-S cluster assembly protein [soil metagenome]